MTMTSKIVPVLLCWLVVCACQAPSYENSQKLQAISQELPLKQISSQPPEKVTVTPEQINHSQQGKWLAVSMVTSDQVATESLSQLKTTLAKEINLQLLFILAYQRNPEVQQKMREWQAVQERYSQAEFLQSIAQQYRAFSQELDLQIPGKSLHPPIAKEHPFPSQQSWRGKILTKEFAIAGEKFTQIWRDLCYQTARLYFNLLFHRQLARIHEEHLQIAISLEKSARDKFQAGLTKYANVLKAQSLTAKLQVELATSRDQAASIETQILALLDLPLDFSLGQGEQNLPGFNWSLENLYQIALSSRQEIRISQLQAEKLSAVLALMKEQVYPEPTVGLSYQETFPNKKQTPPVFHFGQQESYLREIQRQQKAIEKKTLALKQQTLASIRELYFQFTATKEQVKLYQQSLIPLAKETLQAERSAYQANRQVDFLDVLDAENQLLMAVIELATKKRNYQWAWAKIHQTVGRFQEEEESFLPKF